MAKKLIAFMGKSGSGKNTAADILMDHIELEDKEHFIIQFAFADILKRIIHNTFNIEEKDAEIIKRTNIKAFNGLTLREVYQRLGEEMKLFLGNDIWARLALEQVRNYLMDLKDTKYIICTDLRYTIEKAALEKFCEDEGIELYVIHMINKNDDTQMDHISEMQFNSIGSDYTIQADNIFEIELQLKEIENAIF